MKQFITIYPLLLCWGAVAQLSEKDVHKIGELIWHNEAGKRTDLLVFWNEHEPFPSLGIGHFIWYPKGHVHAYTESFPFLCDYLHERGVTLPQWLEKARHEGAPWASRTEFLADKVKVWQLRKLLMETISLQAQFIIDSFEKKMSTCKPPPKQQPKVAKTMELLRASPLGTYGLIDYYNFKGSGCNEKEQVNGHRWGLLQVLLDMPNDVEANDAPKAFAATAAQALVERVRKGKPAYKDIRFLNGWIKRVSTYADQDFFDRQTG